MRRSTHFEQFAVPSVPDERFEPLGTAYVVDRTTSSISLRAGPARIEVAALSSDLFRVGLFGEGFVTRYDSEAVARTEWDPLDSHVEVLSDEVRVATSSATACIRLDPLRIGFEDHGGRQLGFAPLVPQPATLVDPLGAPARVYKQHLADTHYFGCGERTGGLDKTVSHQVFWNVDPPAGHTASLNNLYTSVPFVLALRAGQAWGLFVDSSYRTEFDLAHEQPDRCGFAVDGGPLIYYVFCGPTPRQVLERYTELSGRIPMPPRWALGNHQSRWGYASADQLLEVVRTFRARGLPLDAVYFDIDYMDGYRVFTWNRKLIPDPAELTRELHESGVKLVTIIDPGVKVDEDYPVYTTGRDQDFFCKTFHGEEYHNVVWPGLCAFPDFTNPRVRGWWDDLHRELLGSGVDGIWCDMNEPTVFVPNRETLPPDVAHRGDSEARLHIQVHNLYGQLMARATYAGLRRQRPARRPFVISRAGFAGLQRYALHWTGDNSSWWEHLRMSIPQLQNLGLSGYAWVGVDVGGFAGDATGELLARWTEFGIFQPFCRNHSAWDTRPQEPWAFGEPYESAIRSMLLLRQRLMPYLYTLFEEAHRTGTPILRPLLFDVPSDATTYTADDEFLVGPTLLVAPITAPGVEYRHVYLPYGTWVHYWSGERISGPVHVLAHAPLGQPAVYVRANTPLPMWPEMVHDEERAPDPLTWLICTVPEAEDGAGELYEDAGDGFLHEQGQLARTLVRCQATAQRIDIHIEARRGTLESRSSTVELDVRGVDGVATVLVDGQAHGDWDHADQRLRVRLPNSAAARSVRVDLKF
jgi:alpha-glucosidase